MSNGQNTADIAVKINGQDVEAEHIFDWTVDADLDEPDQASLALANSAKKWSAEANVGDTIEILAGFVNAGGATQKVVFKGEVTGIEPQFSMGKPARVTLRCLNSLHKLSRGRKSKTFTQMSDKDIVNQVASAAGLSVDFDAKSMTQPHVYQHNQTDLEFLRKRATRLGAEMWVEDKKLFFKKRTTSDSGVELTFGESGDNTLESFFPRLSTAGQVSKVVVRSWDATKKKSIIGEAKAASSPLGAKTGVKATETNHRDIAYVDVDMPLQSDAEAKNVAEAILADRMMSYIVGEVTAKGNPNIKPGIIIKLNVGCDRFDGKYYVSAVRHRYTHQGAENGYRTSFKVRRDAAGK